MDEIVERLNKWVTRSQYLAKADPFLVVICQGLGYTDIDLITEFPKVLENDKTGEGMIAFTKHIFLSQLWVLGAYELVRTLDQRAREKPGLFEPEINKKINETKKVFERIRIPLAKLVPSKQHTADYTFPQPIFNTQTGVGWKLNQKEFRFRREFSDSLLALLAIF